MNLKKRILQLKLDFQRLFHRKEIPETKFRTIKIDSKDVLIKQDDLSVEEAYRERMGLPPIAFSGVDLPGEGGSVFIGGEIPVVKHISPILGHTGYSQSGRNEVYAMATARIPMVIEPMILGEDQGYRPPVWLKRLLKKRDENFDIAIIHLTPEHVLNKVPLQQGKYYVLRFYWETDKLPHEFVWYANRVDEVWAFDHERKEQFIKAGVRVPIHVIPACVRPPSPEKSNVVTVFDDSRRPPEYVFYSIFQWTERKNPRALLRAYWQEFGPEDRALLCLKTYEGGFADKFKERILSDFHRWRHEEHLSYYPPVYLYLDYLKNEDILKFHLMGDCYVSPSRGEGWNVPLATALRLGNAAIYTSSGGVTDYLPKMLQHKMMHCFGMEWIPWYSYEQQWCDVDLKDLRKKMREYYEDPGRGYRTGEELQRIVKSKLSPEAVGGQIKKRIMEIRKEMRHGT